MAIKSSPRYAILLLSVHTIVATVVCLTAIPQLTRLALLLLITLSLFYYLARDFFLLLPNSWCEVSLVPDGHLVVTMNNSELSFSFTNQTIVSPYFVLLCVRLEGHRLPISRAIFPDALAADVFRELCVHLKFA